MDSNDIFRLIHKGEGDNIEFKSDSQGVAETACAMTNTSGGTILIGVADDGAITGLGKKDEERVSNSLKGLSPPPPITLNRVCIDGSIVLCVKIDRMGVLVSLGPIAYIRVGRGNRPLSITEMIQRSIQLGQIQFDKHPSMATPEVLDKKLLIKYLEERERIRGIRRKGNLTENAKRLKILVKDGNDFRMSYAGLLCFSHRPQDFLSSAIIRVIELDKNGETTTVKEFMGPLEKMADDVIKHLLKGFRLLSFRVGATRKQINEYPEWSVREAITNAIAHRNYALDADIRIFIHPDHLIVRSPGSFPEGVTPEHPEHKPTNPLISQFLYDLGLIERYGFGITNMFGDVKHHPFCELSYVVTSARVDVIFRRTLKKGLDDVDQKIMASLGSGPMRSTEIAGEINLSRVSAVSRLRRLETLGIIEKKGRGPSTSYQIREH